MIRPQPHPPARAALAVAALLTVFAACTFAVAQVDDRDVPHGVAADWIVGHSLLREGRTADALPYLHMAYRAQPGIPAIAMDFQEALAAEGYVRDALNVVDQLVTTWPDSLSFRLRRSALYLQAGHEDKALADLRFLRDKGYSTPEVLGAEARLLAARGDVDQALDVLRDGLNLHPEAGPDLYLDMSRILQQSDRVEGIPPLMEEARGRYPEEPDLWLVHIRALAALGRDAEALALAKAAEVHFATSGLSAPASGREPDWLPEDGAPSPPPERLSFLVDLADFYAQQGDPRRAMEILEPLEAEGALDLGPSLWLARLMLTTGRAEEGAALVAKILESWPRSGRAWYLKGKVAETADDWAGAIGDYRRAVDLAPHDPEIRLGLVRALLLTWESDLRAPDGTPGRAEKVEDFNDQVMAASTIVPDADTSGQLLLGYAFRALGDIRRAAWRFELAAENPELRLTALVQHSICQDELGQVGKARSDLEVLRREYPHDPEVANSFGYFLAEKNQDLDLAEGLIAEALESDPDNGAYLDSMGWVLYRQEHFEDALDYMIQAANALPDDPVILEHLGMVLIALGQDDEALDAMRRAMVTGGDPDRLRPIMEEIRTRLGREEP